MAAMINNKGMNWMFVSYGWCINNQWEFWILCLMKDKKPYPGLINPAPNQLNRRRYSAGVKLVTFLKTLRKKLTFS